MPPKTFATFDDVVPANIVPSVVPETLIVPFKVSVFLTNILYPLVVNTYPVLTVKLLYYLSDVRVVFPEIVTSPSVP